MARLASPAYACQHPGTAEISGTAISNAFNYYKVEYSWTGGLISVVETTPRPRSPMMRLGTPPPSPTAYMPGPSQDNTGNFVASEPISVTVANAGEVAAEPEAAPEAEAEPEAAPEAEVPAEEPAAEDAPVAEAPAWLTVSDRGQVGISSPAAGDTVSGTVEISGTAISNAFNYYKVEYSVDGTNWVSVAEDYAKTQVADGAGLLGHHRRGQWYLLLRAAWTTPATSLLPSPSRHGGQLRPTSAQSADRGPVHTNRAFVFWRAPTPPRNQAHPRLGLWRGLTGAYRRSRLAPIMTVSCSDTTPLGTVVLRE